ncbi:hypothetical protein B5D77_03125 [Microcystis sp. MC19]|uniref:hypothetical protein n=1 Tax=Microcystis sp. MC19 TaxID=1967666 RepID=UPI000D11F95C|nr:hypothetical protein [Microcystis sp. MC19]AVQ70468.1 hypothetical protein B5D77_03125 [Microcystis sp. MC19]
MVNPDNQDDFKSLLNNFRQIWVSSDDNLRDDYVFIVKKIAEWTNKDVFLGRILYEFFQKYKNDTSIIPDTISEENINQVEERVIEHLKKDPSIKSKLQEFQKQITQDSSCAELVNILQEIWEQSNDESITVKSSDQEKIDKLIEIGLVKKDDKENPIPIHWIYKELFLLDDLAASLSASPTPESSSIQHPNSNTDRQTESVTNKGLKPIHSGLFVVILLLGLIIWRCQPDDDQAGNGSDGSSQSVNQECLTIDDKLSLKDLSIGDSSNGDKDLIIKRDRAITDIEKFLSQQPQKKSLGEICGENYGTRYAELLYDQAIAVASQAYSPSTSQIKYSRREDALCLIREKDIEGSKYTFQQVKDRLKKWEATCPN